MKSTDLNRAAELASDREELLDDIRALESAKTCRIDVGKTPNHDPDFIERKKKADPDWKPELVFRNAFEGKITAKLRDVVLSAPRARLAEIEAELAALGVEIVEAPPEEASEPASPA